MAGRLTSGEYPSERPITPRGLTGSQSLPVCATCDAGKVNNATALDYWTLLIALVGGSTGVAALVTQVWGLVLAGPRVKVTVANALLTDNGVWAPSLDASNLGRLPVTLLDMGVTFFVGGEWQKAPLGAMPHGSWARVSATRLVVPARGNRVMPLSAGTDETCRRPLPGRAGGSVRSDRRAGRLRLFDVLGSSR